MDLTLFMFLFAISFCLVVLGLWKSEHSEFSLIGFFFIFLLAMPLINGTLEYKTGSITSTNYNYSNESVLTNELATNTYSYSTYQNRTIGFWLAIGSFFGFLIILISLAKTRWGNSND